MVNTRLKAKHWAAIIERWCSVTESIYPLFTPLRLFEGTHIGEVRMLAQRKGRYWLHNPEQFAKVLKSSGRHIQELTTCYRVY